jgi:hypothetical protein
MHVQGLSVKQFVGSGFSFLANETKAHNLDTGIYHHHYYNHLPSIAPFLLVPSPPPLTVYFGARVARDEQTS